MEKRRIGQIRVFIILAALSFLLCGCIGHHFLYKFDLHGVCDFSYTARGDSLDIYDPPGACPSEPFFQIETRTEIDSAGTETYILEARTRLRGDSLPGTLCLKELPWVEVFLQHPTQLKRTPLFFASLYRFEADFKGRRRTAIEGEKWEFITQECHALEEETDSSDLSVADRTVLEEKYAAGMLLWNEARYQRRVREIITSLVEQRSEIELPQEWIDSALVEADVMIRAYNTGLTFEELDFADLEWWDDLQPQLNLILAENLNFIGDSTLRAEISHIGELLEMRHQVTEDLLDETFEVRVDLPGRVLNSNSEATEDSVLIWKFDGEELADDDVNLSAFSLYVFADRVIGVLVLIVAVILAIVLKRPAAEKKEEEAPSSQHDAIPPVGHG